MVTDGSTLSAISLTRMKIHGMEHTLRSFPGESCYLQCVHLQPVQPRHAGPILLTQVLVLLVMAKHLVMD